MMEGGVLEKPEQAVDASRVVASSSGHVPERDFKPEFAAVIRSIIADDRHVRSHDLSESQYRPVIGELHCVAAQCSQTYRARASRTVHTSPLE